MLRLGELCGDIRHLAVSPLLSPELETALPFQLLAVGFKRCDMQLESESFDGVEVFAGFRGEVLVKFLFGHIGLHLGLVDGNKKRPR